MSLELMLITNDKNYAKEAEIAGVDRIFIDCEIIGKKERQGHLDTHIGYHNLEDIIEIKKVLNKAKVLTRINPFYDNTKFEVDTAISYGSDIIMLPMFKKQIEVQKFVEFINKRAKSCLLLETAQALVRIDDILEVNGIDEIHIGLNDLHLSMQLDFMFELLSGGIVEYLGSKIAKKSIKWGFGGIARIGEGMVPAEYILAEHIRLGSKMVILSRTFQGKLNDSKNTLNLVEEIRKIREKEIEIRGWGEKQFDVNRLRLKEKVRIICNKL